MSNKRAALYLRVSTTDQTTDNQHLELQRVAAAADWDIVSVFEDTGISGAKGRDQRPQFDEMLKAAVRREFDVVMVWHVDRLGRSLQGLLSCLSELQGAGVDLFIHQQAIDTTTPSGRAMFQMLGVFAEFERCMIQSRVKAGINRARERGVKLGRPAADAALRHKAQSLYAEGATIRVISDSIGMSVGWVHSAVNPKGGDNASVASG